MHGDVYGPDGKPLDKTLFYEEGMSEWEESYWKSDEGADCRILIKWLSLLGMDCDDLKKRTEKEIEEEKLSLEVYMEEANAESNWTCVFPR